MLKKQWIAAIMAAALTLSACSASPGDGAAQTEGTPLVLSDQSVILDGREVTSQSEGAVTVSHDIVYYEAGKGSDYGEGTQAQEHTAQEAEGHTVVTIRRPGTYLVSGTLSAGQLAVDLGEDAKTDPQAVVTLILDGVDITCTVAPALIFYNVYECDTAWVAYDEGETESFTPSPTVDTSAAGANIVLADGSVNNFTGSHVARIYREGTTKKLHKYDGAFYSKMSMNIYGQSQGTGVLNIVGDNEGLDSELHLTIHGGTISIQSQDDGINTNEDGVSVTTVNGGTLQINAGLGAEGDGIDSNGYLVVNGGNIYTMANEKSADGGIDADGDILINGGYVVALGTRNDAVSQDSAQNYMELFFASTLPAGSQIELIDPDENVLLSFTTEKPSQCLTFSSQQLQREVDYTLKVNGVVQQYTGNASGGFGGMGGGHGGGRPDGQQPPELPEGQTSGGPGGEDSQLPERAQDREGQRPQGMPPKTDGAPGRMPENGGSDQEQATGTPSTAFKITDSVHTFSGIADSAQESGKTQVIFSAQVSVGEDGAVSVADVTASAEVDESHIQLTITDVPSEDYAASCLLSDGQQAVAGILPTAPGTYRLTVSVTGDDAYTGANQWTFTIPEV